MTVDGVGCRVAGACGAPQVADGSLSLGQAAGHVLRLRRQRGENPPLRERDDVVPPVGRRGVEEQASELVDHALPLLEAAGGIVASDESSRGPVSDSRPERQWDFPNGWAPHQILAWYGLKNYGYDSIACRLAYRWLYTITSNAVNYNGMIPEKYDLVARSHRVFAEYGNVGTTFAYITREGFGWTNASYVIGLSLLPPDLRDMLNRVIPPEWIFR